ncbi:unnamed protein product, partial [Soboliphyme baturini]|uniref:Ion_trans_2 domain-containing protein n=1 Tax=Soboliphyme baturini TaxID=241478 RepID=A0A183IPP3_9BILA
SFCDHSIYDDFSPFSATLIDSYGNLLPVTRLGRCFCIIYGMFGIPLALVTVANFNKFLSECVTWFHSAPLLFFVLILIIYSSISAVVFRTTEKWSYVDSFYCSLITTMTIGFGDLVPSDATSLVFVIVFVFLGVILSAMCIDSMGLHYIQKIHFLGRQVHTALKDWVFQLYCLQQKYGLTDKQLMRLLFQNDAIAKHVIKNAQNQAATFQPEETTSISFIDQADDR